MYEYELSRSFWRPQIEREWLCTSCRASAVPWPCSTSGRDHFVVFLVEYVYGYGHSHRRPGSECYVPALATIIAMAMGDNDGRLESGSSPLRPLLKKMRTERLLHAAAQLCHGMTEERHL